MRSSESIAQNFEANLLKNAFNKFNQASRKLEDRYAALSVEIEALRKQLRQKDLEIKRKEKLALLGETAAALAHEVRNPLGAMKLFLSVLSEDLRDRPESLKVLKQMEKSVSDLNNLVSNMLQFAKDSSLEMSPLNLHSIICEQAEYFKKVYSSSELEFELKLESKGYMRGNSQFLRQVFHNLLLNAVQAMEANGKVTISSRDLEISLADQRPSGIEIIVGDSGPGLPAHIEESIFDPFVSDKTAGTGLGLAIVKNIVSQHGGSIEARSGAGAQIVMFFPVVAGEKHI